uniref:Uncharacterized protein n=1 Tax=Arundo donax TaxID=35708 RepID=A0A0A9FX03_ARUDO
MFLIASSVISCLKLHRGKATLRKEVLSATCHFGPWS